MCTLVCQTASWILCCLSPFPGVCLNTQWFQGTSVFYLRCRDSVVPDSFWHASCLVLTPRVWDRLVHARSLWSSRNPCWQLLSWHHASPKASKLPLYILHVPGKKKKKLQVQIKQDNYLVWCHRADDFFSAPASQLQQNIWHMNRMKPVSLLMARRTQTEWNWLQKITFLSPIQKLILDIRNSSW